MSRCTAQERSPSIRYCEPAHRSGAPLRARESTACPDSHSTPRTQLHEDADRAFPLWREFTTRKDGVKDGSTGDPVDAGAHYEVR